MGAVLSEAVQFGVQRFHPGQMGLIGPLILVALVICIGAVTIPLLGLAAAGARGMVRSWRGRRRRLRAAASAEVRARTVMSELCPHGWRAQITLFAEGDEGGRRESEGSRVALDWTELGDAGGRAAVMRRVWAPTIGDALDAMVADRRTDETLEQIERGAVADGVLWPDR